MPDGQTLLFIHNPGGTSYQIGFTYMAINIIGGPPKALFSNGDRLDLFGSGTKILIGGSIQAVGQWIVNLVW